MDNDRAIGDCVLRAEYLQRHSERIQDEEFPAIAPVHLAKALGNTAQALAEYLVHIRQSASYDKQTARVQIRAVDGTVKWLFELLRYADGAVTSRVPWSLVGPLQRLSVRLLPGTMLALRPKWRYNYSVLMSEIGQTIRKVVKPVLSEPKIDECFGELRSSLHIVSFPYIERRSVFLHAALTHEIGHLVAEEFIRADKGTMPASLLSQIISAVLGDSTIPPLFKSKEIVHRLSECAEYRKRAMQELGSDIVAIDIMGPAALFALDSIIGMRNLDDIPNPQNQRYPPRRQRIRIMLKEIGEYLPALIRWEELAQVTPDSCKDILDVYRSRIEELQTIANSTADRTSLKTDRMIDIAYQWVEHSIKDLSQYVRNRCVGKSEVTLGSEFGNKELGAGSGFWMTVCDLVSLRLRRGLPPNIIDDTKTPAVPASFEAIMNAGWLYLLSSITVVPKDIDSISAFVEERQRAERLTLRALELSDVQVNYAGWKS